MNETAELITRLFGPAAAASYQRLAAKIARDEILEKREDIEHKNFVKFLTLHKEKMAELSRT